MSNAKYFLSTLLIAVLTITTISAERTITVSFEIPKVKGREISDDINIHRNIATKLSNINGNADPFNKIEEIIQKIRKWPQNKDARGKLSEIVEVLQQFQIKIEESVKEVVEINRRTGVTLSEYKNIFLAVKNDLLLGLENINHNDKNTTNLINEATSVLYSIAEALENFVEKSDFAKDREDFEKRKQSKISSEFSIATNFYLSSRRIYFPIFRMSHLLAPAMQYIANLKELSLKIKTGQNLKSGKVHDQKMQLGVDSIGIVLENAYTFLARMNNNYRLIDEYIGLFQNNVKTIRKNNPISVVAEEFELLLKTLEVDANELEKQASVVGENMGRFEDHALNETQSLIGGRVKAILNSFANALKKTLADPETDWLTLEFIFSNYVEETFQHNEENIEDFHRIAIGDFNILVDDVNREARTKYTVPSGICFISAAHSSLNFNPWKSDKVQFKLDGRSRQSAYPFINLPFAPQNVNLSEKNMSVDVKVTGELPQSFTDQGFDSKLFKIRDCFILLLGGRNVDVRLSITKIESNKLQRLNGHINVQHII